MLESEKYIKEDLSQLFAEKNTKTTLTQIATTTSEIKTFMFNDLVLKNKDTRILKNKEGEMTLMYSFVDKNTIIITTQMKIHSVKYSQDAVLPESFNR